MSSHIQLPGSERQHPRNSAQAGALAADENIQITLILRRKNEAPLEPSLDHHLSHDELAEIYGAALDDQDAVQAFAAEHELSVVDVRPGSRSIKIGGPLEKLAGLFGADVRFSQVGEKKYRTRQGHLTVPAQLADRIVAVIGFDERPVAATGRKRRKRSIGSTEYYPTDVAKLYNFPLNTGKGQSIALIELGGGYRESDLQTYWKQLGLGEVPVTAASVDGVQNAPQGDPDSDDGEVVLDIEVAGAVAPEANIAVYFAPNTDAGFLDAINSAIHDRIRRPSVISISWGGAESEWSPQTLNAFNAAFHDAALLGISVCAAAGDNGSSDGEQDQFNHVDFPASSPWVLACGGTRLIGSNGTIESETVWNDGTAGGATGGGVSSHFSKPPYQAWVEVPKPTGTVNPTGRGVPDVAGVADPETGYRVYVDGEEGVVGGTSAVAPLWAGLIALCNEQLGKNLGWLNPILYGTVAQHKILHDITSGTNGAYHASIGWDCCTGLGTPNGSALLSLLQQRPK
ncbi:MAG: S53 family peptidase [Acidobacteriaceae bacterium]|nr:S53 family peptidase [Acidobacteriaceae bacterium]